MHRLDLGDGRGSIAGPHAKLGLPALKNVHPSRGNVCQHSTYKSLGRDIMQLNHGWSYTCTHVLCG